jgi:hypothetical protein
MLKAVASIFPFSPPAFQASLQTSSVQAHNRTIGDRVNPTRKSDVKNHLSARGRAATGTFVAANKLDIPGFTPVEEVELKKDPTGFVEDFIDEHVELGVSPLPVESRSWKE